MNTIIKNKRLWYWGGVLIAALVLFWSLSPSRRIGSLVGRAIEASGGAKAWKKKPAAQFLETRIFYDPAGQIVDKEISMHRLFLGKTQKARVDRVGDPAQKILLGFDGVRAWSSVNGVLSADPVQKETAETETWRSHYLFSIPFSLKGKGQALTYEGRDKIRINFTHQKKWVVLHFDKHHQVTKILFSHGELAEWLDYQMVDGIAVATRRVFYHADEKGEIKGAKTREELIEEIEFRPYFPGALFDAPKGS